MQAVEKDGNLIITVPKNVKLVPSTGTGKTLIVASSHGFIPTGLQVDGSPVSVMVTATIKNPKYVKTPA